MSLPTLSEDRKFQAYFIEPETQPLPCVLCGIRPTEGTKVLEVVTGEPRLLCADCAQAAAVGFEDLDRFNSDYPLVGL